MNISEIKPRHFCELSTVAKQFLKQENKGSKNFIYQQKYEYVSPWANFGIKKQQPVRQNTYFSPTTLINTRDEKVAKFCDVLA